MMAEPKAAVSMSASRAAMASQPRNPTTARLINTSRGGIVGEGALGEALSAGVIAGAALDVFENEPLSMDHPLRRAPNCILTPHVAGLTEDASNTRFDVADDVVRVLRGQRPEHAVDSP